MRRTRRRSFGTTAVALGDVFARFERSSGEGADASGQSYVHSFETAGEHASVCIPHEAAGMEGVIAVEA